MSKNIARKFDLYDSILPISLKEVSISLHLLSINHQIDNEDYYQLYSTSGSLKEKSRDFRRGTEFSFENAFFWNFYGRKPEEASGKKNKRLYADKLAILSEQLAIAKNLRKEEINELKEIIEKLSESVQDYQKRLERD